MYMQELIKGRFYFIRHGKTDWNDKKLCQGQTDIPLNLQGKEEIKQLCPLIKKLSFSTIFTSSLTRALESALIIQNECQSSVRILDDFKERFWGTMEGASSEEMYRIEEKEEKDPHYNPGRSIEPRSIFKARILQGMNQALLTKDPLIVSHGRVFLVLCELLEVPLVKQIPNAVILKCDYEDHKWQIKMIR